MVATRFYEKYVKAAIEGGIDLIISGAGLPVELPQFVQNTKVKIAPIVSSLKSYEVIYKYWKKKYQRLPDMVVIEGPLAGGHLGFKREELDHIDDLHYDEEVKRIMERVHETEEAYIKANKEDIEIVKSPVGMPGRAIHNAFIDKAAKGELTKGNKEEGLLFCGANAYKAKSLQHVSDIMKEFEEEFSCLQG